jgi:hypothetical protein
MNNLGGLNPTKGKIFSSSKHQDWLWSPYSRLLTDTCALRWGGSHDMQLTTHLHLVLKLRINGFITPLLLYAFIM